MTVRWNLDVWYCSKQEEMIEQWIINIMTHHGKALKMGLYNCVTRAVYNRPASSSGASFFAWQRRAWNEWLVMKRTGTMGRVQTAGQTPVRSCVVFLAKKSFSWHGPIFGLFKSWKRSILVAYCCKHCKLWVDRWMAQNFKTWGRNNRQAAKESVLLDSYELRTSNKIFDDLTVIAPFTPKNY